MLSPVECFRGGGRREALRKGFLVDVQLQRIWEPEEASPWGLGLRRDSGISAASCHCTAVPGLSFAARSLPEERGGPGSQWGERVLKGLWRWEKQQLSPLMEGEGC